MTDHKKISTDEGLKDNEQMEQAILTLQQNPTQEMLAHVLTIVRRRMLAHGQLIVAVEPPVGNQQMCLQAIQTDDGKKWWAAFTSFDEELKGGEKHSQPAGAHTGCSLHQRMIGSNHSCDRVDQHLKKCRIQDQCYFRSVIHTKPHQKQ